MNCALWSSEVYETVDGSLQNVSSAASEWDYMIDSSNEIEILNFQVVVGPCFVLNAQTVAPQLVAVIRTVRQTSISPVALKPKLTSKRTRLCTASSMPKNMPPNLMPEVSMWIGQFGLIRTQRRLLGGKEASS